MKRLNIIFFLFIFGFSIYYVSDVLMTQDLSDVIVSKIDDSPGKNRDLIEKIFQGIILEDENPISILSRKKDAASNRIGDGSEVLRNEPLIYIYNTHQTEAYRSTEYNISPTTFTAAHMLSDELKELGISSLVEERDVMKELNRRKLSYDETYTITREYMSEVQKKNSSIQYFFDVHRDSLKRELSVVEIQGKSYAKMMFLVGTKNPNYQKNVSYIKKMEEYIHQHYKGLLRDTYYKKYVYNQDLGERVFLVEVGGQHNTLEEVYRSIKVLAEAISYMEKGEV